MDIDNVVTSLRFDGYWYTYYTLRSDPFNESRKDALWKIWVARQYVLYKDGRSMAQRLIDLI